MGLKGPIWDETFVVLILEAVFQLCFLYCSLAYPQTQKSGCSRTLQIMFEEVFLKDKAILNAVNQTQPNQEPSVLDNSVESHSNS